MVSLTLRRTHKLINRAKEILAHNPVDVQGNFNIWNDKNPDVWLDRVAAEFNSAVSTHLDLFNAVYYLRDAVQQANHNAGINGLVNKRVLAVSRLKFLRGLDEATERCIDRGHRYTPDGLVDKIQAEKQSPTNDYGGRTENISVALCSEQYQQKIQQQIVDLVVELDQIDDQIAELNATTSIDVDPGVLDTLLLFNIK